MISRHSFTSFLLLTVLATALLLIAPGLSFAQSNGTLRGSVRLDSNDSPLHDVLVTIVKLNRTAETDEQGNFEFTDVPAGTWAVLTHLDGFPDVVRNITVSSGSASTLDFKLKLSGLRDKVTVSASGQEQSTMDAFQSVTSLDNIDLVEKASPSLGDVLDKQPGIAKRSFGPGSTRPIVRGFDGDRVLVLQDGMQLGSVGSQSGDHGEPVDVLSLERLEVVKGPAALLYGSNAIGGVVNAITSHGSEIGHPHPGARGYVTGIGGTNNNHGGVSGGIEYGAGNWLLWGNGSGQRLGDYSAPTVGEIRNSATRSGSGSGGVGYYGEKAYFSAGYNYDNRRYGIPFAGELEGEPDADIDIDMRRHNVNFNFGVTNLNAFVDNFRLSVNYSDYLHRELEIEDGDESVGTLFNNDIFVMRGVFEQARRGRNSGSFGFWWMRRDYETIGDEALAPPVVQNGFAAFALEEFDFSRVSFQFGGRVEHNRYSGRDGRKRDFTGFSGAAGARIALWEGGSFVANYNHSYRAPALEELFNEGPHPGNLTFEIGDINLKRERGDGLDFSLRHNARRFRAEANFFYYNLRDFIYLAPTGDIEDGLPVADFKQGDARYRGTELRFDVGLHQNLWLNLGMDYVDAELKASGLGLPRIPPLRGRAGFDFRWKGLSLRPEVVMVRDQDDVFTNETRTAGYTLFNLDASYTITTKHIAHILSANSFNLGDRLYRNHSSFIKDLAPEIGRGVRFAYTMRFF